MRATAIISGLIVLIAACAASAAAVVPQPAPVLWNGAAAGMNIDQVAALFPQGKASTGQSLDDGSLSAFSVPAQLGGMPADALFFFRDKGLSVVLVEAREVRSGQSAENLAGVRRIVSGATSQYGPPKSCIEQVQLAAVLCRWTTGTLKVVVSYHDVGGGSPALNVFYGRAP